MDRTQNMVISVMGRDRPGIVAEVTEAISSLGGNLADLSETVLCDYFTMILVAGFAQEVTPESVQELLSERTAAQVSVARAEGSLVKSSASDQVYVLTAVGRDRAGLVAQVSRFCADRGVNILDLASHVEDEQYTMILQIDLSDAVSRKDFKADLVVFGTSSGLKLVLQHNDIFRATNEI